MSNDNKHLTPYLKLMSRTNFNVFVNQMFKLIKRNSLFFALPITGFSFTRVLS